MHQSPPIYRRFLSGGTARLAISPASAGIVLAAAILVSLAAAGPWNPSATVEWVPWLTHTAAFALATTMLAVFAARWLGDRAASIVGLVFATGAHGWLGFRQQDDAMALSAAIVAGMAAFAWANVPGRMPMASRRMAAPIFYAAMAAATVAAGIVGPVTLLVSCLLYLLFTQDSRGSRFFADATGIALLVLLVGGRLLALQLEGASLAALVHAIAPLPDDRAMLPAWTTIAGDFVTGTLPWTPLVLLAVVIGLHQGHSVTPFWRFVVAWFVGAFLVGLVASCLIDFPESLTWPPLAVMSAAALNEVKTWWRRKVKQVP